MPTSATISLAAARPRFTFIQQWMNLIALLKYGFFFSALLVLLPLTAFAGVAFTDRLGGLFADLIAWEILFVSSALVSVAWTLMFAKGLIAIGVER